MIKNFKLLLLVSLGFVACNSDEEDISGILPEEPPVTAGSADFSKYVALGNSLTAGFSDGALFIKSQENSYAKLLADQFELAGGGEFRIPFMNDNVGGLLFGGMPNASFGPRLIFNGAAPIPLPGGTPSTETFNVVSGPFNNLGVPGAKSFHLLAPGYGNPANLPAAANPYFVRMASAPGTSVLADAMAQNPTFFSLWIGNNDVLGYALSGGDGTNPITDEATFTFAINTLITTLTSAGAKGVVANIPDVKTIPHFKVVPFNPLSPSNPSFGPMIPTLNATFAQLNQAFAFLGVPERSIQFNTNSNSPVVIHDESLLNISAQLTAVLQGGGLDPVTAALFGSQFGQCRQATNQDLFVLPSSNIIGQLNTARFTTLVGMGVPAATAGQLSINGVTFPLEDKWVLLPSEQADLAAATATFNTIIKNAAEGANLAFVDAFAILTQLSTTGIRFDNFHMTNAFVSGGAFSLDGIHITARGNAYIANKFTEAINATYGSTLRMNKMKDFQIHYPPILN
ncbi:MULTISPECIES: G-D-S-L family lipolytic protein [Flavobacterium]|uniref:Outer membrane protein n=1 Tax=Flavobacterium orientale TaxID=1756020 RepID=A0A916XWI8_9FLAO|nr:MULTISPECIES: G-D-S-L family lipolytic protein [Flavobacterium]GGD18370.1 outer membrane protein [Flavobacterium orientale]